MRKLKTSNFFDIFLDYELPLSHTLDLLASGAT